jgi:hypothetical protein
MSSLLASRLGIVYRDNTGKSRYDIKYCEEEHLIYTKDKKNVFDTIYSFFVFCGVADEYEYFLVSNRILVPKIELDRADEYFEYKEKLDEFLKTIKVRHSEDELYQIEEECELPNGRIAYKGYLLYKEKNWANQVVGVMVLTDDRHPIFYYRSSLISIPHSLYFFSPENKSKENEMLLVFSYYTGIGINNQPRIVLLPHNLKLFRYYLDLYPNIKILSRKKTNMIEVINYNVTKYLLEHNTIINGKQSAYEWFLTLKNKHKKGRKKIEEFIFSIKNSELKTKEAARYFPSFKRKLIENLLNVEKPPEEILDSVYTEDIKEEDVRRWFDKLFNFKRRDGSLYIIFDNIPYEIELNRESYKNITLSMFNYLFNHKLFVGAFPMIEYEDYAPIFIRIFEKILLEIVNIKCITGIENSVYTLSVYGINGRTVLNKKTRFIKFSPRPSDEIHTEIELKEFKKCHIKLDSYDSFCKIEQLFVKLIDYTIEDKQQATRKLIKNIVTAPISEMFGIKLEKIKINFRNVFFEDLFKEIVDSNPFVIINNYPFVYNRSVKEDTLILKVRIKTDGVFVKKIKKMIEGGVFESLYKAMFFYLAKKLKGYVNPDKNDVLKAIDKAYEELTKPYDFLIENNKQNNY